MRQYNLSYLSIAQFLFADRNGGTLVVSPGSNGEMVYRHSSGPYEVVANTNEATSANALSYDRRHQTASDELQRIVDGEAVFSAQQFAHILSRVAQAYGNSETSYFNVFDLTNGLVYLYAWHDFTRPKRLVIAELLDVNEGIVYEIDALCR